MSSSYSYSPRPLVPLILLGLWACAGTPEREGLTVAQAHMYAHFDRAGEVHDALVKGDLEGAKAGANWLATHQDPDMLPVDADQHVAFMKRYADRVTKATTLPEAAGSAAQMGRTCGDCHRQNQVRPGFLVGTAPPTGSGAKAEMARHIWASERMWEGLVGPDDYAWTSGAKALREGWLNPSELGIRAADQPKVRAMVQNVYELGSSAEATADPSARAEVYGKFLTTCIECHQLTGAIIRGVESR